MNNFYGWAVSKNLLTDGFRWVANLEKLKDSIIEMAKKVEKGNLLEFKKVYLLEVDMSFSQNLHDLHNDLPFMCKNRKINSLKVGSQFLSQEEVCHPHSRYGPSAQARIGLGQGLLGDRV